MKNLLTYNKIEIPCPLQDGHRMIPVKTVCDIIDVQFKNQDSWLKGHRYFSQLYLISGVVAADNKVRDMNCLPLFDLLIWLGCIDGRNRRSGSIEKQYAFMAWLRSETMRMYKLIEVFEEENKYELELMQKKVQMLESLAEINNQTKEIKKELGKLNKSIEDIREKRFTGQTALPFPDKKK